MAVARRRGLEAEILVSLAVVMVTATAVLGGLLVETHEANVSQLQRLAARSLVEERIQARPGALTIVKMRLDPRWNGFVASPQFQEMARRYPAEG